MFSFPRALFARDKRALRAQSRQKRARGQATFELIVVVGAIALVSAAVLLDITNEQAYTSVLTTAKASILAQVASFQFIPGCAGLFLKSMRFDKAALTITFDVEVPATCTASGSVSKIADDVESQVCSARANGNNLIECGGYTFTVQVV